MSEDKHNFRELLQLEDRQVDRQNNQSCAPNFNIPNDVVQELLRTTSP